MLALIVATFVRSLSQVRIVCIFVLALSQALIVGTFVVTFAMPFATTPVSSGVPFHDDPDV